ncbi:Ig-like domain-containing protein [Bacillus weihaiensis]|uniref:Bacterial Ig domain-containing protein n=1 Tax=Bacillus weihaiensis TaxID=1547283 RepID=A0A1L3MMG7_9BACI|nr:Ig-like domain-containing protein [Bacillus weihaiensis]APH03548.1 hypothetical protein A9C19_01595 [Bacillus weihaiensis]
MTQKGLVQTVIVCLCLFVSFPSFAYTTTNTTTEAIPRAKNYVVISNESTDPNDTEKLDSFQVNNEEYSSHKNLKLDSYQMDARLTHEQNEILDGAALKSFSAITPSYDLGETRKFWVVDFSQIIPKDYQLSAKLMYQGSKANIWVNDNNISILNAKKLADEFDQAIYPTVRNYFGPESDVDKDKRINILLFDIKDGFDGYGGYFAGYFYPGDLYYQSNSNKSEIFYIDTYPLMGMGSSRYVENSYETLAHEFQHMVNFNRNVLIEGGEQMDVWLDEALSMAAEQIYTGEALTNRIDYYNSSSSITNGQSLLYWDYEGDVLANYSLSYLFGQYVKVQAGVGNDIFKKILENPANNYKAVESQIKQYIDPSMTFGQFMTNFRAALLLKESTGPYGFKGEKAFDQLVEKVSIGSETNLQGGGALVKEVTSDYIPVSKRANVTYTYFPAEGGAIPGSPDTIPPAKPTVNQIGDNTTTVSGKAEINSTVYVKAGSTLIGSGKVSSTGSYSIPMKTRLKAGTGVMVYAQDPSGNKSQMVTMTVLDKTAPAKPKVGAVGDNTATVSGTAEVGTTVYVKLGDTQLGKAIAASSGAFSIKMSAKQKATKVLTLYAVDSAGNKSSTIATTVLDKTAPSKPTVKTIGDNTTTVTGTAEASSTLYIKSGTTLIGKGTVTSKGTYSIKLTKKQKAGHSLSIYAIDKAGNKSSTLTTKVVDRTPPQTPIINKVSSKTTYVKGKAEKGAALYVYKGSNYLGKATVTSTGAYSVKIKAQKKGTTLTIYAKDKSGNKSPKKYVKVS